MTAKPLHFWRWAFLMLVAPARIRPPYHSDMYVHASFRSRWRLVKQRRSIKRNQL